MREDEDLNALMRRRREELEELRKLPFNPFPYEFERNAFSAEIVGSFKEDEPPRSVSVAGRIMSIRRMGKASFCHILDAQGKIQIYLRRDDLGEPYDMFRLLDIGDIIGVKGFVFRTKMGEISVHARELVLLSKSLRPLPVVKEKVEEDGTKSVFDPFSDKELRYRQRYVDLIVSPHVREVFLKRAKLVSTIRRYIWRLRRRFSSRSTAGQWRGLSRRITTRWISTCIFALPTSSTSRG